MDSLKIQIRICYFCPANDLPVFFVFRFLEHLGAADGLHGLSIDGADDAEQMRQTKGFYFLLKTKLSPAICWRDLWPPPTLASTAVFLSKPTHNASFVFLAGHRLIRLHWIYCSSLINFKQVNTLTLCSQCTSPPPIVNKQAPGSLIGPVARMWCCSPSSPGATGGSPPWFPRWPAPWGRLQEEGTAIQEERTDRRQQQGDTDAHSRASTCKQTHTTWSHVSRHTQRSTHPQCSSSHLQKCKHWMSSWKEDGRKKILGSPTFNDAGLGQVSCRSLQGTAQYEKAGSSDWQVRGRKNQFSGGVPSSVT